VGRRSVLRPLRSGSPNRKVRGTSPRTHPHRSSGSVARRGPRAGSGRELLAFCANVLLVATAMSPRLAVGESGYLRMGQRVRAYRGMGQSQRSKFLTNRIIRGPIAYKFVRASPPRGSICYFGRMITYLAIVRKKCRPPRTSILYFYVSNRIALDFWSIFLEIEAKSYHILLCRVLLIVEIFLIALL
jgi:hypothetical protein